MADVTANTRGEIPTDLQGALALARESGNTIAATVYEEALAGKVAHADVRDTVLTRELEADLA